MRYLLHAESVAFCRHFATTTAECSASFCSGHGDASSLKYNIAKNDHMTMSSPQAVHQRIVELEVEHRDLDEVIETLIRDGRHEELQLRRLKKRKLQLKDNITLLKMQLIPDIPA